MNKVIAALLSLSPSLLVPWVYPWIAKPMLTDTGEARVWAQRIADSFGATTPIDGSAEQAFAQSLAQAIQVGYGLTLSTDALRPLMFAVASKALNDPDFPA